MTASYVSYGLHCHVVEMHSVSVFPNACSGPKQRERGLLSLYSICRLPISCVNKVQGLMERLIVQRGISFLFLNP